LNFATVVSDGSAALARSPGRTAADTATAQAARSRCFRAKSMKPPNHKQVTAGRMWMPCVCADVTDPLSSKLGLTVVCS
jgi:hypothetical protein